MLNIREMCEQLEEESKKLLPCPFCGGKPQITFWPGMNSYYYNNKVVCNNKDCAINMIFIDKKKWWKRGIE